MRASTYRVPAWVIALLAFFSTIFFALAVNQGIAYAGGDAPAVSRDANWSFHYTSADDRPFGSMGFDGPADVPDAPEPDVLLESSSGVLYSHGEIMVSFDGSIDEPTLVGLFGSVGLTVSRVSLISKSLEGNDVLVLVSYLEDVDPLFACEKVLLIPEITFAEINEYMELQVVGEEDLLDGGEVAGSESVYGILQAHLAVLAASGRLFDAPVTVNDPFRSQQWSLNQVRAEQVWGLFRCGGSVIVAIIDSGVDFDHPDLVGNLVDGAYLLNTYTDTTGYDAVDDVQGHGTHVAGIIAAASNNGYGVAGISGDAKLLPIAAGHYATNSAGQSSYGLSSSDIIEALDYLIALKQSGNPEFATISVVNMSIGGYNYNEAYAAAVLRAYNAGILVVAAAGNDSTTRPHYPSAYPGVLAVTAAKSATTGVVFDSSYSNYGDYVDLCAPGTRIISTVVGGGYGYKSGTSMATPFVAGISAMLFAGIEGMTPDLAMQILAATATDLGAAGWDEQYGHGLVNPYDALLAFWAVPEVQDHQVLAFTGEEHSVLTDTQRLLLVTAGDTSATEAGTYTFTARPRATFGQWPDGTTGEKTFTWTIGIEQVDMSGVSFQDATFTYDGQPHGVFVSGQLPEGVTVTYENNGRTELGTYTVTARFSHDLEGCDPIAPMTATLTIEPIIVEIPRAYTDLVWNGGIVVGVPGNRTGVYAVTDNMAVEPGTYTARATLSDPVHCLWEDGTIGEQAIPWSISRAKVDVSGLEFADMQLIYDGKSHAPQVVGALPEGVSVTYYCDPQTDAGVYTFTAVFVGQDTVHYEPIPDMQATLQIDKATYDMSGVVFASQTVVYDGAAHTIMLQGGLPAGVTAQSNALPKTKVGEYTFTVTFSGDTRNYHPIAPMTATLSIIEKVDPLAGIGFEGATFTYDGTPHSLAITGQLPEDITVRYVGNGMVDAGVYEVTAVFTYVDEVADAGENGAGAGENDDDPDGLAATDDEPEVDAAAPDADAVLTAEGNQGWHGHSHGNGNGGSGSSEPDPADVPVSREELPVLTATLVIEPATYDMSGITMADLDMPYTGAPRSIMVEGQLPAGVSVSYEGNGRTEVGQYTVTAHFVGDTRNYRPIPNMEATLTIHEVEGYVTTVDLPEFEGDGLQACADGETIDLSIDDEGHATFVLERTDIKSVTVYTFNREGGDLHGIYPIHMYVWLTVFDDETGTYTSYPMEELTDVLQYAGSSIRLTDPKGIRLITGVDEVTKTMLQGPGIQCAGHVWKLQETGTVIGFDDQLAGEEVLRTNTRFQNFAYKRGEADPVFARGNGVAKFTNVLVGFSNEQCSAELSMRPYLVLVDETGGQVTVYGGTVHRSIGYIAWQNRNAFAAGTEAYNYIWGIIHTVYGEDFEG